MSDAEHYWAGFSRLDAQAIRLTGSRNDFTRDEVIGYFLRCRQACDRYDFLLVAPDGGIVGESVINEIDGRTRSANFRILIFRAEDRGRGLGGWMTRMTRDFAFSHAALHRLSLDVFSVNPRARKAYENAGFHVEGVLRDAVMLDDGTYADDILMAMLEDEWRALSSDAAVQR